MAQMASRLEVATKTLESFTAVLERSGVTTRSAIEADDHKLQVSRAVWRTSMSLEKTRKGYGALDFPRVVKKLPPALRAYINAPTTSTFVKDGIHEVAKHFHKNFRQDVVKKAFGKYGEKNAVLKSRLKLELFAKYLFRDSSPESMARAALIRSTRFEDKFRDSTSYKGFYKKLNENLQGLESLTPQAKEEYLAGIIADDQAFFAGGLENQAADGAGADDESDDEEGLV
ncbi:hypothetical protein HDU98_002433 [Podochytrium sp. JEL0797]|nr:hypothetical protein HDU98_002431 [Podochytrium sp. JEL0797]KAJ3073000.1 hypothetical protein HDU98_002433 [Podochytrium sp. JEL0797]